MLVAFFEVIGMGHNWHCTNDDLRLYDDIADDVTTLREFPLSSVQTFSTCLSDARVIALFLVKNKNLL